MKITAPLNVSRKTSFGSGDEGWGDQRSGKQLNASTMESDISDDHQTDISL